MKLSSAQKEKLYARLTEEFDLAKTQSDNLLEERKEATQYYKGDLPASDREDQSRYTSTDVHDVVQLIMPQLIEMFCSQDSVVEFKPNNKGAIDQAQQRTDYVNYVCKQDNPWVSIVVQWVKDALTKKIGFVKAYYDDAKSSEVSEFEELDEISYNALLLDDNVEVVHEEVVEDAEPELQQDPETGEMVLVSTPKFNVQLRRTASADRIVIEPLPPEEVIWEKGARAIDNRCNYIAHITRKTKSELVAMDIDPELIDKHIGSGTVSSEEDEIRQADHTGRIDERGVSYGEHYMMFDLDEDGIDERYCVTTIGDMNEIVRVEGCGRIPIVGFTPDPEPHTVAGSCPTDYVKNIQKVKTQVVRDVLDNLGQSVFPREVVNPNGVIMDDVLNYEIGSPIREKVSGSYRIESVPFVGQQAFPLLQWVDDDRESKTGVSKPSAALDPKALQSSTREAVTAVTRAVDQMVKYIARIFAETSLSTLFVIIDELARKHQDRGRSLELRGEFVNISPKDWDGDMSVQPDVAAIAKTKEEQFSVIMAILSKQEMILQTAGFDNPIVSPQQYANALRKMATYSGIKDPDEFFTTKIDPKSLAPKGPAEPTPEQQIILNDQQYKMESLYNQRLKMFMDDETAKDKINIDLLKSIAQLEAQHGLQIDMTIVKQLLDQSARQQAMDQRRDEMLINQTLASNSMGQQSQPMQNGTPQNYNQ